MRYVIYGAGAIGGVIGGRLHLAGNDVTLIARGAHLAALQRSGLQLDTADGVRALPIPAVAGPGDIAWTSDTVVLLCVKSQQTLAALEDLVAAAPPGTVVVSCQNGVANEREILRRFARTYAMVVVIPGTHIDPGVVVENSATVPGILDVGCYPAGVDDVATRIGADLSAAGFAGTVRADIMAWKHRKLLGNLGNGVEAATSGAEAQEELFRLVAAEGEAVLAAAGIAVVSEEDDAANRAGRMERRTDVSRVGSSTRQSLTRGTDVEVDYLSGEIVMLGRLHGVPTPANELVQRTVHDVVRRGAGPGSVDAADLLAQL
jgi:2-dehydropantoate 2-reductase